MCPPAPVGVTISGSKTPTARMLAVSSARSPKSVRGLCGLSSSCRGSSSSSARPTAARLAASGSACGSTGAGSGSESGSEPRLPVGRSMTVTSRSSRRGDADGRVRRRPQRAGAPPGRTGSGGPGGAGRLTRRGEIAQRPRRGEVSPGRRARPVSAAAVRAGHRGPPQTRAAVPHPEPMDVEAVAAELLARMDRDQQARTRQPPDPDEMAAVDADNTGNAALRSISPAVRRRLPSNCTKRRSPPSRGGTGYRSSKSRHAWPRSGRLAGWLGSPRWRTGAVTSVALQFPVCLRRRLLSAGAHAVVLASQPGSPAGSASCCHAASYRGAARHGDLARSAA